LTLLHATQGATLTVNDNTNNTNPYITDLRHLVTAPTAPTTGFGARMRFILHSAARTSRQAATLETLWTSATDGAEISRTVLSGMSNSTYCYAFALEGTSTTNVYNFAFIQTNTSPNYQSMKGGIYQGDITTEPSGNPSSGLYYYSLSGGPKWRTSSGKFMACSAAGNFSVDGSGTFGTGFGCNGQAAQTAYASGGALAAYVTGAFGLDSDANMSALHAMVVKIRAALVANGIMS
jgi:hypothetical protein